MAAGVQEACSYPTPFNPRSLSMTMTIDDPKFIASWQKVKNGWDAVLVVYEKIYSRTRIKKKSVPCVTHSCY